MIIGPKYKIARRLNAPVFEKTQTEKYALSLARKTKTKGRSSAKTDYGMQVNEKQKARMTYGMGERQFARYVKEAVDKKGDSVGFLLTKLESRLDNVVLRAGLVTSRRAARQMVSHGHICVNEKRVTIPSYTVTPGEKISIREGSKKSHLFATLDEKLKQHNLPAWLKVNIDTKVFTVEGKPTVKETELLFNVATVLEFYSR
ncbi:MAG TPA: 30S ribosomal protein S4 [Candidatus Paceibacterota bacterium]